MRNRARLLEPGLGYYSVALTEIFLALGDDEEAERWLNEGIRLDANGLQTLRVSSLLAFYRGDFERAAEISGIILERNADFSTSSKPFIILFNVDIGNITKALAVIEKYHAELLSVDNPEVNRTNYHLAITLAALYQRMGQPQAATILLERSLEVLAANSNASFVDIFATSRIYALQGKSELAISSLRANLDNGWTYHRLNCFDQCLGWESIRDHPELVAMVADEKANLAAQLDNLRRVWSSEFD